MVLHVDIFLVSLLAVAFAAQNQPAGSIVNAAENGDLAAVQEMLADPALSTVTITKALTSAAIAGHQQIVKVLLQDARSSPEVALVTVYRAHLLGDIFALISYTSCFGRYDLAYFKMAYLNHQDDDKLDILTFRFSHDPAMLAYLTELQLARVVIPEALKPAFNMTLQILPGGGGPRTIAAYRQLVRALAALQLVVKAEGPMAFLPSELVANIAAHMLDK